jgi:pheromone shutdown protein TraB
MRGLGSKVNAGVYGYDRVIGLTLSRLWPTTGTAKMRVDWAFVSGVSLVSPSLKLIDEYRMGDKERHWKALIGLCLICRDRWDRCNGGGDLR